MRIGIIGLGTMGSGMAHNLIGRGFDLVVFNRNREKAEPFAAKGARVADTVTEFADRDIVVTMVTDDAASAAIMFDGGLIDSLRPGAIHVESSTVGLAHSRRLAAAHGERGTGYVAAPVSGRGDAARRGELLVIAAGEEPAFERCGPLFEAIGRATTYFGEDPVAAHAVKLGVNAMLAGTIGLMAETYNTIERCGIGKAEFHRFVSSGFLGSPAVGFYGGMIAEETYSPANFTVANGLKDVRLALQMCEDARAATPMLSAVRDTLMLALAQGLGEDDWGALGKAVADSHKGQPG